MVLMIFNGITIVTSDDDDDDDLAELNYIQRNFSQNDLSRHLACNLQQQI